MKEHYIRLTDYQRICFVCKGLRAEFENIIKHGYNFVINGVKYEVVSVIMDSLQFIAEDATSCEPELYPLMKYYYNLCYFDEKQSKIELQKPTIEGDFEFYNKSDGKKYKAHFIVPNYTIDLNVGAIRFERLEIMNCLKIE